MPLSCLNMGIMSRLPEQKALRAVRALELRREGRQFAEIVTIMGLKTKEDARKLVARGQTLERRLALPPTKDMKITKGYVEQVTVECPLKDKAKALNWVFENGYRTIYSGPKPLDRTESYSRSTYQIIAGKDIPGPPQAS